MEISSDSQKIRFSTTAEPMPWVASPKAAVLPEHARVGEQPVAGGRPRYGPAGEDVADGQRPHVDAEDAEPVGGAGGEDGAGQLRVGHQGGDLEQRAEDEPEEVQLGELVELPPGAGDLGQEDVLADEEQEEDHQRDLHVARQPAPAGPGGRRGLLLGLPFLLDRVHRVHACTSAVRPTASSKVGGAKLVPWPRSVLTRGGPSSRGAQTAAASLSARSSCRPWSSSCCWTSTRR